MKFFIALPTYNRAATLPRALDSLIAQTHADWHCMVLDDGSTDGTREVVGDYCRRDPRIYYLPFDTNRGGVRMNVEGMLRACATDFDAWTRLGSDDWFGPRKLELDNVALQTHEACWGCYDAFPHARQYDPNAPHDARHGVSCSAAQAKADLLNCTMRASWANCAVRLDVLRRVRDRFGFEVPGSRNLEDLVINARVAAVTDWRWRGILHGGYSDTETGGLKSEIFEAAWSDVPGGATANQTQCSIDINASARACAELRAQIGWNP